MSKKKYEVVWERKEVLRELAVVWAENEEEAEELSWDQIEDSGWDTSVIIHAEEYVVQVREAEDA